MNNFLKLLGVLVVTVIVPLVILLGIWAGFIPQAVQVMIGVGAVIFAAAFIIGGNLILMWGDIKTGRYSTKK